MRLILMLVLIHRREINCFVSILGKCARRTNLHDFKRKGERKSPLFLRNNLSWYLPRGLSWSLWAIFILLISAARHDGLSSSVCSSRLPDLHRLRATPSTDRLVTYIISLNGRGAASLAWCMCIRSRSVWVPVEIATSRQRFEIVWVQRPLDTFLQTFPPQVVLFVCTNRSVSSQIRSRFISKA